MPNQNSALLVMDVQAVILDRLPDQDAYLNKARAAVEAARRKQIPVVFVVVGFRAGAPEASERFKTMAAQLTDPQPFLAPAEGDIVVVKRRVSAFSGSDLEVFLRAQNINHLVLCGVATSGVVLSTTREAADKDYDLTILSDACADTDDEVHGVLINKILPRQAKVTTVEAWAHSE